jgi:hypothetical protein
MLRWEDVHFQLVDLPAIAAEHPLPWLTGTLQSADACLLVVDLADPDCVQQVTAVQEELARRKVSLVTRWPADAAGQAAEPALAADEDVFALRLPTLLLANKSDLLDHADTDLEVLAELEEPHFPGLPVSAQTGAGLGVLRGERVWPAARAGTGQPVVQQRLAGVRCPEQRDLGRALRADHQRRATARTAPLRAGQLLVEFLDAPLQVRLQVISALVLRDHAQHLAQVLEALGGIARLAEGVGRRLVFG